eukprot:GFUD01000908.1.p1 GENE.GFUD01000908.1~~GFUD01000908.1.p1  ORF type:complete len:940 (+),score=252.02 GFUD01000908.1:154-2973(+)
MTPTPTTVQRKHGVGLFKPVSWNKGRRFTSPGPGLGGQTESEGSDSILNYEGPLLRLQIEAYLDDHPDFTESYVLRKVKKSIIDKWLNQNAQKDPEDRLLSKLNRDQNNGIPECIVSKDAPLNREGSLRRGSYYVNQVRAYHSADGTPVLRRSKSATPRRKMSSAVTPHRKISAATFEGGCQSPLLTTAEDGTVSFLTVPPNIWRKGRNLQSEFLSLDKNVKEPARLSNIPDIHDNLTSEMNQSSLCFKIAKNISLFSKSVSTSILQVKRIGQKIYLLGSAVNIKLNSVDDGSCEMNLNFNPELYKSLVQLVHEAKPLSFKKKEVDAKFGDISFITDDYEELVIMPLPDVDGKVHGLAFLCLGPTSVKEIMGNKLIGDIAKLSGTCMKNATDFQSMRLELTRSQVFLELARVIFDNQTSIEFTVLKMLANFLILIQCERAQILLSSKDAPTTFRKVYDLEENDLLKDDFDSLERPFENRFPINSAITGLVAALGETVNIGDISSDQRFDHNLDNDAQFEHRSLLCMPIMDSDNKIIGVVSLINKKTGFFTSNDENFVEAFGIFCGISLANVSNYEQVKAAEARKQVALDIMTYHASSSNEEAKFLTRLAIPSALSLQLQSFSFTDVELEDIDTLTASIRMFHDLDLIKRFNLDHSTMCRWILTVKKNYRPEVTYHNWRHAFNVAQVMFSSLINSGWWEGLGPITCLGLLVACLCHDLDHRGTNNSYQMATNSPLAKLYSTSTLERHHLNQALIILNLDGNRIFDSLSPAEYTAVLSVIEEAILATDLSLHFAHLGRLKNLSKDGPAGLDWENQEKVSITMAALMTASDLGASTKPFQVQRKIAGMVAEEFWYQGDLEKAQLNTPPVPMMDRELRHELPRLQVGFCEGVCLPVYRALACLSPALQPMEEAVIFNRDRWAELAENNQEEEEEKENKVTRNL